MLHLSQQVWVEAGWVDVDRGHQQGWHQLAIHPQTNPTSQCSQSGRQQLPVAAVDGRSPPACLGPVVALIWSSKGDGGGQRSAALSAGPPEVKVCYMIRKGQLQRQRATWHWGGRELSGKNKVSDFSADVKINAGKSYIQTHRRTIIHLQPPIYTATLPEDKH